MGVQFILGLRTQWNRWGDSSDSYHPGSVGKNIGELLASRMWGSDAGKRAAWNLNFQTAFRFSRSFYQFDF
jgi:hypothetical protein